MWKKSGNNLLKLTNQFFTFKHETAAQAFLFTSKNGEEVIASTPPTPGFEAVFAIAGLMAAAYIVLRREE